MHNEVWLTILGLSGMMAIAVVMLPLTRRIGIPYTVFLAIVGIAFGLMMDLGHDAELGILSDLIRSFGAFELSSEVILFVFLPALVFESSLSIDVRRLMDDIGPILFLAIAGLVISAFTVGGAAWMVSTMPFVVCLLLGAIVSATDPVAVVAIFKDLGAPKRLAVLVEGESLFNDATAIVLFHIVAAMLIGATDPHLMEGVGDFVVVFFGGAAVGFVIARLFALLTARMPSVALVEVTLSISLAYLSFLLAEHYLHVSGVMATVTAALVVGSHGRTAISASGWHLLTETWESIGFWANSLIFVLVGIAVPEIMATVSGEALMVLVVVLIVAFGARAALTHFLLPCMSLLRLSAPVSIGYRTVMWWGGLRGAVSLALALAIFEDDAIPASAREFIVTMVCGFVLFTLFVNATTVGVVLRAFGLDRLSPADLAIRNRVLGRVLGRIANGLPAFAESQRLAPETAEAVQREYRTRAEATLASQVETELEPEDWMRIGLLAALGQERRLYLDQYAAGHIGSPAARDLLSINDEMLDHAKAHGVAGWQRDCGRVLGYDFSFRLTLKLHRRLGLAGPLARRIEARYERLRTMQVVMLSVCGPPFDDIARMIGAGTATSLRALLEAHIGRLDASIGAIRAQYPDYTAQLEQLYLERCALRQEHASYRRMHDEALIGGEVFGNLEQDLDRRADVIAAQPRIDLAIAPAALIAKVPIFARLDRAERERIARLMRPHLAIPGESVIRKGDPGSSMYFVSSGALRVDLDSGPVIVGTGGFVGELALLRDAPRTADCIAAGFSDLLVLDRRDLRDLMDIHPDLKVHIEDLAKQRLDELTSQE